VFDEEGFDSEEETSLRIPETAQHSKELCKRWGSTPKKSHLVSPLSTNAGRRRRGRTRGTWSSKYRVGCGGQPRAAPRSHRRTPQSQCGGLEGGPAAAMTAGAACFFPACYPSPAENGDNVELAVAIFHG
jgi:hypothetical protein